MKSISASQSLSNMRFYPPLAAMEDNEGGDRAADDCGGQVVHVAAHARRRHHRALPRVRSIRQGVRPPQGIGLY